MRCAARLAKRADLTTCDASHNPCVQQTPVTGTVAAMATTQDLALELIDACRRQDRSRVVAAFDTVNREQAHRAVAAGMTVALYHLTRDNTSSAFEWQQRLKDRHQRWATISGDTVERLLGYRNRATSGSSGGDVGQETLERAMLIDTIAHHHGGDTWEVLVSHAIEHAIPHTS